MESKFAPRFHVAIFLGYAPGVTNGYFVMRGDGVIELTSNITDDTALDEPKPVLQDDQKPRQSSKEKASYPEPEKPPEEPMLLAVMGLKEEKVGSISLINGKCGIPLPWMIHSHRWFQMPL